MKLNVNQKAFCREYIKNGMNGTSAYMKAYGVSSEETAMASSSRLLRNVKIKEYIESLQSKVEEKAIVTIEEIVNELKAIAFSNGSDYASVATKERVIGVSDDGKEAKFEYTDVDFKDTDTLTQEQKKAISCIKKSKNGISVETYDKVKALELLGKYTGLFKENTNVNLSLSEEDKTLLKNVSERLK